MSVAYTLSLEVQFTPGVWTVIDAARDVVGDVPLRVAYGIVGNGPLNRIASTGELGFALRNDAGNAGSTQGWYSPAHASCRSGWTFGILARVRMSSGAISNHEKFRGKIRVILPAAGRALSQRVAVVAYDPMRDLAETDARAVTVQVNKTEAELIAALLASLPAESQPPASALDAGLDLFPFAFDDLQGGTKALSVLSDVVVSALGSLVATGDGTVTYVNRHTLASAASAFTFTDDHLVELIPPSSLDRTYNRVRVTIHPKSVSAAATDELYTLAADATIAIDRGASLDVWTDYTDPDDRQTKVGGTSVVTTLIGGTHYGANSAADGSGTDLTASVVASLDPFSSTAKWTLTNSASQTAYVRLLRVVGKAVRDLGAQTYEASATGASGDRPLSVDLPYQNDSQIGQSAAHFLRAQYAGLAQQVDSMAFLAHTSSDLMTQALLREPGDCITLSETVTGLTAVDCLIQSVELEARAGGWLRCRWGLAPASPFRMWQIGVAGLSELGVTTMLGF